MVIWFPPSARIAASNYFANVGTISGPKPFGANRGRVLRILLMQATQDFFNLLNRVDTVIQIYSFFSASVLHGLGRHELNKLVRACKFSTGNFLAPCRQK